MNNDEYTQLSLFDQENYRPSKTRMIKKSNALIHRIGRPTLVTEKIFLKALEVIEERDSSLLHNTSEEEYYKELKERMGSDFSNGLVSEIKTSELKKALRTASHKFYNDMDDLLNTNLFVNSWNVIYHDDNVTGSTTVITGTAYDQKRGTIFIKWNPDVRELVYDLHNNYTELDKDIINDFKSIYSLSLYQLLRDVLCYAQSIDKKRGYDINHTYHFEFNLSELKFVSGMLTIDPSSADKRMLQITKLVQAEKYESAEEKLESLNQSVRYADFRRYALSKAYKEINGFEEPNGKNMDSYREYEELCKKINKTDIHFTYSPIRNGKGGKVTGVAFDVRWSDIQIVQDQLKEKTIFIVTDEVIDAINEIIDEKLKLSDIRAIAKAANNDIDQVRKAYETAKKSKKEISNLPGFLIAAINGKYDIAKTEKKKYSNKFNNFQQNNYDFDEIEKSILSNEP